jgi:DNA-binding MarR family transcriptional regulator
MSNSDQNRQATDQVLVCLRRIIQSIDLHSRQLVKTFGLTGPQLAILHEVSHQEELTPGQIAKGVSLSQATDTGILDRLQKRGLIDRVRSTIDRRKVYIKPTDSCRALLEKAPPLLQESFVEAFHELEDWEQSMILSSLQRIVDMMNAQKIAAEPVLTTGPINQPLENSEPLHGIPAKGSNSVNSPK